MLTYGVRGQVGGMITLLNLRLDFAILGAMAGPAVLGAYAVASKYAELLRLPGTALTWVCYPMLAGMPRRARPARRPGGWSPPTLVANLAAAVPFVLLAGPVIGLFYGDRFDAAVAPAQVLVVGMLLGGAAGRGQRLPLRPRPARAELRRRSGSGLALTVVLDLLLIPPYGVMGAAVASTATYLLADAALIALLLPGQPPREPGRQRCRRAGGGADVKRLLLGALVVPALLLGSCLAHDRLRRADGDRRRRPRVRARAPADRDGLPTAAPPGVAAGPGHRDRRARRWPAATPTPTWPASCTPAAWTSGSRPTSSRAGSRVPPRSRQGLDRLGQLAVVPGVKGFKVADELGYEDGLDLARGRRTQFLRDVRTGLAQRAPDAQVLVDVVVPELGCLGWTAAGSTSCAEQAVALGARCLGRRGRAATCAPG